MPGFIPARKRLGQHFLADTAVLEQILEAVAPEKDELVVEIGSGTGVLTVCLAQHARRVVAVDVDPRCVSATLETAGGYRNVEVRERNALEMDVAEIGASGTYVVAGNLPYNITTPLLAHIFTWNPAPQRGVFLIQREVAARLAAGPGDWSLATVIVRSLAEVEPLAEVPASAFEPPPKVTSSIVRLRPHRVLEGTVRGAVIALARSVFQMRRKTLRHGLTYALQGDERRARAALEAAGIDPGRRPGTLSLEEWSALAASVPSETMGR